MGRVHGERKLNTPAVKAKKIKTSMPDDGRLDLTSKGFSCNFVSLLVDGRKEFLSAIFSVEEDLFKLIDRLEGVKFAIVIDLGIFSLAQWNPTSISG